MEFPKVSAKISRGLTYSYIHIPPSIPSKSYVLILHGFPSLPTDFRPQITHLSAAGYGIIAPELLGYGDTSKPADSDPYRLKLMAGDMVDILDRHSVPNVLAVAHDWGSTLLARLEFYHPERISKMALLTVTGGPFGQPFDVDAVNSMMKERVGYEGFGYMKFFTEDSDAASILNSHQESFRSVIFAADASMWKDYFGAVGGLKGWVQNNRQAPVLKGYTEDVRKEHEEGFSNTKGGYTASLNWYRNHVFGKNVPDEQAELKAQNLKDYQTRKPLLAILSGHDPIAMHAIQRQMCEAYAPQAKFIVAEAGHWVMLEAAEPVNQELTAFFAA